MWWDFWGLRPVVSRSSFHQHLLYMSAFIRACRRVQPTFISSIKENEEEEITNFFFFTTDFFFFFFWILIPVLPELRDSRSTDLTMRTPTQLLVTFLLFSFFDGNYHRFLTCCCFLIWRMDDTGGQCRDQSNYCGLVQTLELCYIPRYRQHCCQTCQNHPSQIVKEDRTISNSRTDKKSTTKKKKKKIKKIKKVQIPTNSSVSAAAARL